MPTETVSIDPEQTEAIRRAIARLGSTSEVEVSVVTKKKPSEVRRALQELEAQKLIRRTSKGRSRHFGDSIELTVRGRRSLA